MKKVLATSISIGLLALPVIALAQNAPAPGGVTSPGWEDVSIEDTLNNIIDYLFGFLLIVAAIGIVIAAYLFITAQGDAEKIKTARNFVIYSVIAVVVAFLARALVYIIDSIVG